MRALFECEHHAGHAVPAGDYVTCDYIGSAVRVGWAMVVPLAAPGEGRALVRGVVTRG